MILCFPLVRCLDEQWCNSTARRFGVPFKMAEGIVECCGSSFMARIAEKSADLSKFAVFFAAAKYEEVGYL